jgi:hypothetical protein
VPVELPAYAGTFALEIDGTMQRVRRVYGCNQPRFDAAPLPCRLELNGLPKPDVLNWIRDSVDGSADPRPVSLLELNGSQQEITELSMLQARITRVGLTDLDAQSGDPAAVVIDLEAALIDRLDGDGHPVTLGTITTMPSSSFRLTVDGTAYNQVIQVTDLSIDLDPSAPASGTFTVVNTTASSGYQQLADWGNATSEGATVPALLELLNPSQTTTLLAFELPKTGTRGYPEPFGVGDVGSVGTVRVEVVASDPAIS